MGKEKVWVGRPALQGVCRVISKGMGRIVAAYRGSQRGRNVTLKEHALQGNLVAGLG